MRCPNGRGRRASTIASARSSPTRIASPGRSRCRIPCSRRCGGSSTTGSWSSSPPPSRATTWFRGFWWPCRSTRSAARPERRSGKVGGDEVETVGEDRVDAPGKQTPGDLRVVHRIAEKPVARAANLLRLCGCQVFAVAVHGDAPERLRGFAPIGLDPVGEKSAIEFRRGRACRLESDALEGREQRRGRGAAPQLQRELRGGGARFALESLRRLDLDVGPQAELDAQLPGLLERGHALAAVFGAEPGAGVQAREPRVRRGGHGAPPVGGALERLVVDQHRDLVGRKHDVELDAAETRCGGLASCRGFAARAKKKTGEGRVSPVCRRLLGRRATCRRPADAMFASADAMRFGNDGIISSRSSRKQAARQEPESEFPACFVTFLTFSLPWGMPCARGRSAADRPGEYGSAVLVSARFSPVIRAWMRPTFRCFEFSPTEGSTPKSGWAALWAPPAPASGCSSGGSKRSECA